MRFLEGCLMVSLIKCFVEYDMFWYCFALYGVVRYGMAHGIVGYNVLLHGWVEYCVVCMVG